MKGKHKLWKNRWTKEEKKKISKPITPEPQKHYSSCSGSSRLRSNPPRIRWQQAKQMMLETNEKTLTHACLFSSRHLLFFEREREEFLHREKEGKIVAGFFSFSVSQTPLFNGASRARKGGKKKNCDNFDAFCRLRFLFWIRGKFVGFSTRVCFFEGVQRFYLLFGIFSMRLTMLDLTT